MAHDICLVGGCSAFACDIGPGAMIAEACLWVQDYPASEVSHDPKLQEITIYIKLIALDFFPYQNFIYGYGSIPITVIPFLVGWTSNYQLFWCSPGVPGFWHTAIYQTKTTRFSMTFYEKPFIDLQSPQGRAQHLWYGSGAIMWPMRHRQALRGAFHFIIHHPFWSALTSLFAISAKSGNYFLHSSILHLNHT